MNPYRKKLWLWLLVLIVLPFVLLVSLLGVLIGTTLASRSVPVDRLARYMPADTAAFVSVRLSPEPSGEEAWDRVEQAFLDIPGVREGQEEALSHLQEELHFDWQEDVVPWLGDTAAIALTDLAPLWQQLVQPAAGRGVSPDDLPAMAQVPLLLALEVRDPGALQGFLAQLQADLAAAGHSVQEVDHAGMTILVISTDQMTIALAPRDDQVLLVSGDQATVEAALDRGEENSLSANPEYRSLVDRLPPGGMALGFLSYAQIDAGLRESMSEIDVPLYAGLGNAMRSAGFTLLVNPDGLRLILATAVDLDALDEAGLLPYYQDSRLVNPGRALEFLPRETVVALSGQNLLSSWEMQMAQLEGLSSQEASPLRELLDDLTTETGLDLEEDVLAWMDGEYALFLSLGGFSAARGGLGLPFQVGLVLEVGDQDKARQAMQQFEQLLEGEGEMSFQDVEIEGIDARTARLEDLGGEGPSYAFVEGFLVLTLDKSALQAALVARNDAGKRLQASPGFQAVLQGLPQQRTSLLFVDIDALAGWIETFLPLLSQGETDVQGLAFLDHFSGLGIAASAEHPDPDLSLITVFVPFSR